MQHVGGEERAGTHLALLVDVEGQTWFADVGFGSSLSEPIAVCCGRTRAPAVQGVSLSETDDGGWRYSEYENGAPFSFDFTRRTGRRGAAGGKVPLAGDARPNRISCRTSSPSDALATAALALRGKVLSEVGPECAKAAANWPMPGEFAAVLNEVFGIDEPQAGSIWPQVEARHAELFAEEA